MSSILVMVIGNYRTGSWPGRQVRAAAEAQGPEVEFPAPVLKLGVPINTTSRGTQAIL